MKKVLAVLKGFAVSVGMFIWDSFSRLPIQAQMWLVWAMVSGLLVVLAAGLIILAL